MPSLRIADVLNIFHYLSRIFVSPSFYVSSTSSIAPGRSYLLAKIKSGTPRRSSSDNIVSISVLDISTLSRSILSITYIIALVLG